MMFPIAYASKTLAGAPKSYATVEKVCMAMVLAIDKFSCYLHGRSFTLQTDHHPLTYQSQVNALGLKTPTVSI